jgi:phosphate transport system permease protein
MPSARIIKDKISGKIMLCISIILASLLVVIAVGLLVKSLPVLRGNSFWELISSSDWHPMRGKFGMLPFIAGTLWVTAIAIIIAVPTCLLASIYLSEYANRKVLGFVNPFIDILAGIPSVVFGVWGVVFIVPFIRDYVAPFFGFSVTGYSILAGGFVLGIMIVPVILHVLNEVLKTVAVELREASLSLGATKWETIKLVVLRKSKPGVIAAIVLGLSRAFGETMAVLMVVGNVVKIPHSLFDPGYPLPALIANNYGEMLSIPSYDSALMFSALILLIIVVLFNILSRIALVRIEKMVGT